MREIVEGVFMWSRLAEPQGYDFNGFFVPLPDGNIVIDPVEPEPDDLARLSNEGVARILITNRNHSRAANQVREATGALTAIHRSDADHAQGQGCIIDEAFSVGEMWGPLQALPARGKSRGEVALHWPDRRILFLGDAAIGNPPGRLSLLPVEKIDNLDELKESLSDLLSVDFDAVLTGDGEPILTGGKAALQALVDSFAA